MVRINIVEMLILPKVIYRSNVFSIEMPMAFIHRTENNSNKMYMNTTSPKSTAVLRKGERVRCITMSGIKLYNKGIKIKTAWYRHKNRHINSRNKIAS